MEGKDGMSGRERKGRGRFGFTPRRIGNLQQMGEMDDIPGFYGRIR